MEVKLISEYYNSFAHARNALLSHAFILAIHQITPPDITTIYSAKNFE